MNINENDLSSILDLRKEKSKFLINKLLSIYKINKIMIIGIINLEFGERSYLSSYKPKK